jgi:hypothetical protein
MRTLARRLLFRWTRGLFCIGEYEGIRICDFAGEPHLHEEFLARTIEALDLLKDLDPRRFRRVLRYVPYIAHVRSAELSERRGAYDVSLRVCYVCAADYTADAGDASSPAVETTADSGAGEGFDAERSALEYQARTDEYRRRVAEYDARQLVHDSLPAEGEEWLREQEALSREYQALEREYLILSPPFEVIDYAASLIHEATHGLLEARRIAYTRRSCLRIERLCLLEERRFIARHWPWNSDWLPKEPKAEWYLNDRDWPFLARLLTPRG